SLFQGYFRWEACDDAREMRRQILGGFLMGVGGVTALGCTVRQGLSAASVLAWSAPLALGSIFIGAWLGLHILIEGSIAGPFRAVNDMIQRH
ncbi:MAG: YeeE/YedE thiosulfate transporter family protein, partial [Rhizobiaceae bacterium]